jgi:hypothetical protein
MGLFDDLLCPLLDIFTNEAGLSLLFSISLILQSL